jgi:hypothetical protein
VTDGTDARRARRVRQEKTVETESRAWTGRGELLEHRAFPSQSISPSLRDADSARPDPEDPLDPLASLEIPVNPDSQEPRATTPRPETPARADLRARKDPQETQEPPDLRATQAGTGLEAPRGRRASLVETETQDRRGSRDRREIRATEGRLENRDRRDPPANRATPDPRDKTDSRGRPDPRDKTPSIALVPGGSSPPKSSNSKTDEARPGFKQKNTPSSNNRPMASYFGSFLSGQNFYAEEMFPFVIVFCCLSFKRCRVLRD